MAWANHHANADSSTGQQQKPRAYPPPLDLEGHPHPDLANLEMALPEKGLLLVEAFQSKVVLLG
jgi:hypothetical protein